MTEKKHLKESVTRICMTILIIRNEIQKKGFQQSDVKKVHTIKYRAYSPSSLKHFFAPLLYHRITKNLSLFLQ